MECQLASPSGASEVSCDNGQSTLSRCGPVEVVPSERGEWSLPALGEPHASCGREKGYLLCECCGEFKGTIHDHCDRPVCPECWTLWARRQAKKASEKLMDWRKISTLAPRHVILCPPPDVVDESGPHWTRTPSEYRREALKMLKVLTGDNPRAGGACVLHPWRFRDLETGEELRWRESSFNTRPKPGQELRPARAVFAPHFHDVLLGYLMDAGEFYAKTGWTYKTKGTLYTRDAIAGAVYYMLSHAGINPRRQTLTYVGVFANNRHKLVREEKTKEPVECKECNTQLMVADLDGTPLRPAWRVEVKRTFVFFRRRMVGGAWVVEILEPRQATLTTLRG